MERISRPALVRKYAVFSPIMINAIYILGWIVTMPPLDLLPPPVLLLFCPSLSPTPGGQDNICQFKMMGLFHVSYIGDPPPSHLPGFHEASPSHSQSLPLPD